MATAFDEMYAGVVAVCDGADRVVGTAFFIARNLLVTAKQVVADAGGSGLFIKGVYQQIGGPARPSAFSISLEPLQVPAATWSHDTNIALLKLDGEQAVSPFRLAQGDPPAGSGVVVLGVSSRDTYLRSTPGQIDLAGGEAPSETMRVVNSRAEAGNSGAPIIDADTSEVCGIVITRDESGTVIGAVPISAIRRFLAYEVRDALPPHLLTPGQLHVVAANDAPSDDDLLGVGSDAEALAALIAAHAVKAPLAIAIAGRWGSGKSTFAGLVRQAIDRLVADEARSLAAGSSIPPADRMFVRRICHVTFNAWHYSDDQLWVGIIENLFAALAEHFSTPALKVLTPREAIAHIETLRRQKTALETASAILSVDAKNIVRSLREEAGSSAHGRPAETASLLGVGRRLAASALWAALKQRAVGLQVTVPAAVIGVVLLLKDSAYAWFISLLPAAVVVGTFRSWLTKYRDKRNELMGSITQQLNELDRELSRLEPVTGLADFLTRQADGEPYGAHRGVVGMVYQDLTKLHKHLAEAEAADDASVPARIVLHIDDIERCEPSRIAAILRAISFLQNPEWRFVIVATVDFQPLLRALRHHHVDLFDATDDSSASAYTAEDYLEKIFQLVFGLESPGIAGVAALIDSATAPPISAPVVAVSAEGTRPGDDPSEPASVDAGPAPEQNASIAPGPRFAAAVRRAFALEAHEVIFMRRMAPLLDTPRAVKRFSNVYRLVRLQAAAAGLYPAGLAELSRAGDTRGEYQVLAVLIAIQARQPAAARTIFADLRSLPGPQQGDSDIPTVFSVIRGDTSHPSAERRRIAKILESVYEDEPFNIHLPTYGRWCAAVSRYSFHTLSAEPFPSDLGEN